MTFGRRFTELANEYWETHSRGTPWDIFQWCKNRPVRTVNNKCMSRKRTLYPDVTDIHGIAVKCRWKKLKSGHKVVCYFPPGTGEDIIHKTEKEFKERGTLLGQAVRK